MVNGNTEIFNRATFEASSSSFLPKPSFKAQDLKQNTNSKTKKTNTNSKNNPFSFEKSNQRNFPLSHEAKHGIFRFSKSPNKDKENISQSHNNKIENDYDSDASMEDATKAQNLTNKRNKNKKRKRRLQNFSDEANYNQEYNVGSDSDTEEEEEAMPNDALFAPPQFYFQGRRKKQLKQRSQYNNRSRKSDLPATIWSYMHLLFNIFVIIVFCYIVYLGFKSVLNDIENKAEIASSDIIKEIGLCADSYKKNQCDDPNRPPALEDDCREWQKCMQRDPLKVARATLSAQTIAEVLNSFVEPLSYKSMFFLITFVLLFFFISNMAFKFVRGGTSRKRKKIRRNHYDDDDDYEENDNNAIHQQQGAPPGFMPPAFQYPYPYYNYGYHPHNTGGPPGVAPFLTPPPRNRIKGVSRPKRLKEHGENNQKLKRRR